MCYCNFYLFIYNNVIYSDKNLIIYLMILSEFKTLRKGKA